MSATMYAQVVESDFVARWNRLQPIKNSNGDILVEPPPEIVNCAGSAAVHDLQLSQISPVDFTSIAPPLEVFKYVTLPSNRSSYMPYLYFLLFSPDSIGPVSSRYPKMKLLLLASKQKPTARRKLSSSGGI